MDEIQEILDECAKKIQLVADQYFASTIRPFLEEHKFNFITGNGAMFIEVTVETPIESIWKFHDGSAVCWIDFEKLPEEIRNVLEAPVDRLVLGLYMEDYNCSFVEDTNVIYNEYWRQYE